MHEFKIEDMTCAHCAGTIESAVKAADPTAKIEVDLGSHSVRIESAQPSDALIRAIESAGYSPQNS